MAELTVTAVSVTSTPVTDVLVRAQLTDSRGASVTGFNPSEGVYVSPSVTVTDAAGEAVLDLVPNADITPPGTYYTIQVGDLSALITKTSDPQTLLEALE